MIVFSLRVVAPAEKRWALQRSLAGTVGPTRVEPGCLDARLYTEAGDLNALLLIEEWETHEDFARQLDGDKLKTLISAIELSCQAPVMHIACAARERGMESLGDLQSFVGSCGR